MIAGWNNSRYYYAAPVKVALHNYFEKGMSSGDAALAMSRRFDYPFTRNMVIGKWSRMGLKRKGASHSLRVPKRKTTWGEKNRRPDGICRPSVQSKTFNDIKPSDYDMAAKGCTFDDFGPGDRRCRWPLGDPKLPGFKYCGEERDLSEPYCEHHMSRAYRGIPKRKARSNAALVEG